MRAARFSQKTRFLLAATFSLHIDNFRASALQEGGEASARAPGALARASPIPRQDWPHKTAISRVYKPGPH